MAEITHVHHAADSGALNVVFVHGLGGTARETWMHNPRDHTTLWPRWIGQDAECHVWLFGYDAAVSGWTDAAMHLADQGLAFASELVAHETITRRPLVLIGHSLGGLVIKSGLVQAATLGDPRFQPLLDALAGIVFVGTPHQGASLATVAAAVAGLLRTNPQVKNMVADDPWLKMLHGQFRAFVAKHETSVGVFQETRKLPIGLKVFGLRVGGSVMVVDANSSDPQLPNVAPTPLPLDHIQIAKPKDRSASIHQGLLTFLASLRRLQPAQDTPQLNASEPSVPVRAGLVETFERASAALLTWPSTLGDGTWLDRPELAGILESLESRESGVTLLLGEPGSGKSALLARICRAKLDGGWPVLALKADRLPPDVTDRGRLSEHLGLDCTLEHAVLEIAKNGPVVVVLDQLDALADLVVQQSARLRVLLDLIAGLAHAKNVHVLASCRTFEQRHDPSLRTLEAEAIRLELPTWEAVLSVLGKRGVAAQNWNEELQEVLRSPHALDMFLQVPGPSNEIGLLRSFHGILQHQWSAHVIVPDPSGRRRLAMLDIARQMAEREVLGLPEALLDQWGAELRQLAACGLLRLESPGRVEFRHQTLYEFVRARAFLDQAGSLTEAVLKAQSSLRVRPQLWHALAFFRSTAQEDYLRELRKLWSADIRPHLRMLITEFLGKQIAPLPGEMQLVSQALEDRWFRPRFIAAAVGSSGWFSFLAGGYLPRWMRMATDEAAALVPLLDSRLSSDSAQVRALVKQFWLIDPACDELSLRVLGMGNIAPHDVQWVDDLALILSRTTLSDWAVDHVTSVVSASLPNEAARLFSASLRRRLAGALSSVTAADGDEASYSRQQLESLLEARGFHSLPAVAEAAPESFVSALWPLLETSVTALATREHWLKVGFRTATGLDAAEYGDDEQPRRERPLWDAMRLAVKAWAKIDAQGFIIFAEAHSNTGLLPLERLLAQGMAHCASSLSDRVFKYLESDSRRLTLGPLSDMHKDSVALVRAIAPHLSASSFARLESLIMQWKMYKPEGASESDPDLRLKRLRWTRQHRLRLLRALPLERCSAVVRRTIEEEERAFPSLPNADVTFSGVHAIGSPVSAPEMGLAAEHDLLKLFEELHDDTAWDHPRHSMKGGAIQAGRSLAELAKTDAEKAIRVVRALKPGVNELPSGMVVRELPKAGYPPEKLFALIEELVSKGFNGPGFRRDVAYAIQEAVTAATPVPVGLIDRLEQWLEERITDPASEEGAEREESEEQLNSAPILWGDGGFHALPDGNFPLLAALCEICWTQEPPELNRWLGILERHLARRDAVDVWRAISRWYLGRVGQVGQIAAERFVDRLFTTYPQLLRSTEGIDLIARAFRWASSHRVEAWIQELEGSRFGEKAMGELAMLRHAMFPAENWPRKLLRAALDSASEESSARRVGMAHAAAHMWGDPLVRPVVHPYLIELTACPEENVLQALSDVFQGSGFWPGPDTGELLDAIVARPMLLQTSAAERLAEILEDLVIAEPERVCKVAHAMLDAAGRRFGDISTSWYLRTDSLLAIALRLQDLGDEQKRAGAALFERMLEFNLPQARDLAIDLDKRTATASVGFRPARRRRRNRAAPK